VTMGPNLSVFVRFGFFELCRLARSCLALMASPAFPSPKDAFTDPSPSSAPQAPKSSAFSPLTTAYSRFSQWRKSLDLPNPGTVENLQKEVKCACFLSRV